MIFYIAFIKMQLTRENSAETRIKQLADISLVQGSQNFSMGDPNKQLVQLNNLVKSLKEEKKQMNLHITSLHQEQVTFKVENDDLKEKVSKLKNKVKKQKESITKFKGDLTNAKALSGKHELLIESIKLREKNTNQWLYSLESEINRRRNRKSVEYEGSKAEDAWISANNLFLKIKKNPPKKIGGF